MASTAGARSDAVTTVCYDEQLSETVILAVAEAKDVDPLELDPLYTVVDPDALNSLFQSSFETTPTDLELRFSMAGCEVVVHGDGEVVVTPPQVPEESPTVLASHDD